MIQLDCNLIQNLLTREDCVQYLSHTDVFELGLCSHLMYEKCKKRLFKQLNLNEDEDSQYKLQMLNVEMYYDEILLNQISIVQDFVTKHNSHIYSVSVDRDYNYFTVASISKFLPHLTQLRLYNLAVPTNSFQIILNNLPSLHELSICYLLLAYPFDARFSLNFQFPSSIEIFNCVECHLMEYSSMHPIEFKEYSDEINIYEHPIFDISDLKLPNLKQIVFQYDEDINANTFNQLFENNPTISDIDTQTNCLDNNSFTLFSTSPNLTKLSVCLTESYSAEKITAIPILSNIKHLYIEPRNSNLELAEMLIKSCPNLESLIYCYYHDIQRTIQLAVESLKHLKKVDIPNAYSFNVPLRANFLASNIEYIGLHRFDPFSIDLDKFSNLKNLKNIKITASEDDKFDDKDAIIKHFSSYTEWKILFFIDVIQLWKI